MALTLGLMISAALTSTAGAQLPGEDDFGLVLPPPNSSPLDVGADGIVGDASARQERPGGRAARRPRSRAPRNGRRCVRVGSVRTCTRYRHGRAVRICTKRGDARERCRRPRRARRGRAVAVAGANVSEGFYAGDAPMGRFYALLPDGRTVGFCSGTLIAPATVITAAHCLYDDTGGVTGRIGYLLEDSGWPIVFVPHNQFAANGGLTSPENASAPYGAFAVSGTSVAGCWPASDLHCDVGLAGLTQRAGDVAGWYQTAYGVCCAIGQRVISAGYPGAGAFELYENGMGNAPYVCVNDLEAGSGLLGTALGAAQTGFIQLHACHSHKGTSGGPVWTLLGDGNWYLTGVNNIGTPPIAPVQDIGGFQPFDDVYVGLYCSVFSCAGAARAGTGARHGSRPGGGAAETVRGGGGRITAGHAALFRTLGLKDDGSPWP